MRWSSLIEFSVPRYLRISKIIIHWKFHNAFSRNGAAWNWQQIHRIIPNLLNYLFFLGWFEIIQSTFTKNWPIDFGRKRTNHSSQWPNFQFKISLRSMYFDSILFIHFNRKISLSLSFLAIIRKIISKHQNILCLHFCHWIFLFNFNV